MESVDLGGIALYRVSDVVLEVSDLVNCTITISVDGIGEQSGQVPAEAIQDIGDLIAVADGCVVVKKDNAEINGLIFPKAGIYYYDPSLTGTVITKLEPAAGSTKTFTTISEVVHKVDSKFLPINIVSGSSEGSNRTLGSIKEDEHYIIGKNAFAEGSNTRAFGASSHAEGYYTTTFGDYSHAEGSGTISSIMMMTFTGEANATEYAILDYRGNYSFRTGDIIKCNNVYAKIVDCSSSKVTLDRTLSPDVALDKVEVYAVKGVSYGEGAHTEGYRTTVTGNYSHAEGQETKACSDFQHVQGKYNVIDDSNKYAHIVGNGHKNNYGEIYNSNAHTLDWSGNAWFAGNVFIKGSS